MKLESLGGKRVCILGYGREGKSTERYLKTHFPDAELVIADQTMGPDYLDIQNEADIVVKTPGIPARHVSKPHTTATNIFFENVKHPVIGVTGSKGKSTTASLIAAIIRASGRPVRLVGNIGAPALDALDEPFPPDGIYVMELSSYQLEDVEFSPHIAVFTTFFPEHLDYHGGEEAYFEAKANIVKFQTKSDLFVFHADETRIAKLATRTKAQSVPAPEILPFEILDAKLHGPHNVANMRLALAVARALDVPDDVTRQAILSFEPLPHRLTDIGTFRGIRFVDDAISTAPESTIFAIETVGNVDMILLGGQDRGYDFTGLATRIVQAGIRNIALFPDTGIRIERALVDAGAGHINRKHCASMEEAVRFAYDVTEPGKACVLSTASPSYSLWKDFEEKGEDFVRCVTRLGK